MSKVTLEIAVFSVPSALDAIQAGAHRIELCENPNEGVLPHPMVVWWQCQNNKQSLFFQLYDQEEVIFYIRISNFKS